MKKLAGSFLAGTLFGLGLAVSQMINPQKVQAFLNLAGDWDPSLALVLLAAVAVSALGYRVALRMNRPLAALSFQLPNRQDLDWKLVGGAALFGVGWGLAGYCPGPAIAALVLGSLEPVLFVVALGLGMLAQGAWESRARSG